ncbi:MAG: hypothetical protein AB7E98_11915 [Pirellulales bacterium]
MRAYVTILDGDAALLPFFVRHYRRLGATEFPVLLYGDGENASHVRDAIEGQGGRVPFVTIQPSEAFSARHREREIGWMHTVGEWAFFADLDEFAEITPDQVQQAVRGTRPYIAGRWIDRVGRCGELVDVVPGVPLEAQFPMAGRLRQAWKMGDAVYVLSPRAPTLHHPTACSWGRRHWPQACVRVHHFKWQTNVVRRLADRLVRIRAAGKVGSPWAHRVRTMLAHLDTHQGIDPNLLEEAGNVLGI